MSMSVHMGRFEKEHRLSSPSEMLGTRRVSDWGAFWILDFQIRDSQLVSSRLNPVPRHFSVKGQTVWQ
jgi:hypothetical protein